MKTLQGEVSDEIDSLNDAIAVAVAVTAGAAIAGDKTRNAPGGTGVEQSTEFMGATDKQGDTKSMGAMKDGPNSSDEGGTGIKGSSEGNGATNKSTEDPTAPMGDKSGMSTGNARGTGVEQSTEGQGSTNKN